MNKAFAENSMIQVINKFTKLNTLDNNIHCSHKLSTLDKQGKDRDFLHNETLNKSKSRIWKQQTVCMARNGYHVEQSSQEPYLELKVPPPLCCAYSEITVRAHTSQVFAISLRDIGCEKPRNDMLNLDFALAERSSFSILDSTGNLSRNMGE